MVYNIRNIMKFQGKARYYIMSNCIYSEFLTTPNAQENFFRKLKKYLIDTLPQK